MKRKVRKAVFPAAGMGTRFLPATKAQPKETLPLVDKPLIQYGVEEALDSGVDNIIVVTGRGKAAIEDHFDRNAELEHELESRGKTAELKLVRRISDLVRMGAQAAATSLFMGLFSPTSTIAGRSSSAGRSPMTRTVSPAARAAAGSRQPRRSHSGSRTRSASRRN